MRVLRVVSTMNPTRGGIAETIRQASLGFLENKHEMDVLCFDYPDSEWIVSQEKIQIHAIGKKYTRYGVNFRYFNWLFKNVDKYDVVIFDGLWQFFILGGFILRIKNIPFCIFSHGMLDPYFNKDKLKFLKKLPFWFLFDLHVTNMAKSIIFTCEEERLLASKSFPLYKGNGVVSTLGIESYVGDTSEAADFFRKKHPELAGKKFGLFLSRIDRKKGLDLLISAVSKVNNISDDFVFVIAGPDNASIQDELIQYTKELNIEDKFVWVGMLLGKEKWGAYFSSEFFVLPSHQENFGIVVAEALSSSTPVLITDKVNIYKEVLKYNSGLVADDTVEGIVHLLNSWFNLDLEEKKEMKILTKKCFESEFSLQSSVSSLFSTLECAIKK